MGGKNVAEGETHDDGQIESPKIEGNVPHLFDACGYGWQQFPGEKGQAKGYDQYESDAPKNQDKGCEERDFGTSLYHWEEQWDDDRGHHVGNNGVNGERSNASAEFFGNDRSRRRCGTNHADKSSFEHKSGHWFGRLSDEQYQSARHQHADALKKEVPDAWTQVVHPDFAEREVEHDEDNNGQELHQKRPDGIAHRL